MFSWLSRLFGSGDKKDEPEEKPRSTGSGSSSRKLPEWGTTRTTSTALRSGGWKTPKQEKPDYNKNADWVDQSQARNLTRHEYRYTPDEWELARGAYKGVEGFEQGPNTLHADLPQMKSTVARAAPMTQEAYDKLSPAQKRAVDFNTMLVEAVQADLNRTGDYEDRSTYDAMVEDIFGEGGGSETIAPRTVALLDQIGFKAKGQDLDAFLSLDRGITLDELSDFEFAKGSLTELELMGDMPDEPGDIPGRSHPKWGPGVQVQDTPATAGAGAANRFGIGPQQNKYTPEKVEQVLQQSNFAEVRSAENMALVDTAAIQLAGEFIDKALRNASAWDFDSAIALALGQDTGPAPIGYADPTQLANSDEVGLNEWVQNAYSALMNPEMTDLDPIWADAQEIGMSEEEIEQFFQFADTKSKQDMLMGIDDPTARSPQEIREMLGLDPIGGE